MHGSRKLTLSQYALRRGILSGTSQVRHEFPFAQAFEAVVQEFSGKSGALVSFAHYDYLGMRNDPRVLSAAQSAIDQYGVGVGASRLVGGERLLHRDLEQEIAAFVGTESALSLVSGYGTNVSLISHLLMSSDLILYDEASHNSIISGTAQSRAEAMSFRHNDLDHLASLLRAERSDYFRALVVVEGLYSMDGDVPDLPRLLQLCRDYDVWLMVDEAHSIGVLGPTGGGLAQHFGIDPGEIDIIVGTLSKAFLSCGGFIAAKSTVIEWLRATLPGFVYSVGIAPSAVAAARTALDVLRSEPQRLRRMVANSTRLRDGARARGLDPGAAFGAAVVPLLFPDTSTTLEAAKSALAAGYFVPPIVQIGVPKHLPRLRFFVTAAHEPQEIDGVLDALAPYATAGASRGSRVSRAAVRGTAK